MNANCKSEINKCNTLNQMFAVINKYYDLDKQFGIATGLIVKANIIKNFDNIIDNLKIPERNNNQTFSTPNRNKFF